MRPLILGTPLLATLALVLGTERLDLSRATPAPTALESLPAGAPLRADECGGATLLRRVREAALVGLGTAASDAAGNPLVAIDSVLGGKAGVPASRPKSPVSLVAPQRSPRGARTLALVEVRNRSWVVAEVVALDPVKHAGLEALLAASLARDPSTASGRAAWASALALGVTAGGSSARRAAAEELEADAGVVAAALDPTAVQQLATVAASLDGHDPVLASLLELLAGTGDPTRAREIVDVVERPNAEAVLDRFPRWLKALGADAAAGLLEGHTTAARPALERRRATHVLARLATASAHPALTRLAADADPDVQSEAVLGLHLLGDPAALAAARRIVRAHLLAGKRAAATAELDQILARRAHDELRSTVLPTGERFRLMVGGFVLLRAGDPDKSWLVARLGRLDDATVARFLERRANEPWAAFDARW